MKHLPSLCAVGLEASLDTGSTPSLTVVRV
jgi:hypothetical protein